VAGARAAEWENAVKQYRELRAHHGDKYNFAEYELNWVGRGLLEKGKQADAIAILKLNAEQYPDSFDVYDSLGEAYLRIGDKWAAEQSFRRSLQIYPGSDNYSRKKLDALLASTRKE
jgi:serine-type D-Ala-D-Ala carboxypeptidase/endopeptidase